MRPIRRAGLIGCRARAERHRPWQRAADLDDLEPGSRKSTNVAPRPVTEVPGRVAELAQVLEPRQVEGPPERLARDADISHGPGQPGERSRAPRSGSARCSSTSQQTTSSAASRCGSRSVDRGGPVGDLDARPRAARRAGLLDHLGGDVGAAHAQPPPGEPDRRARPRRSRPRAPPERRSAPTSSSRRGPRSRRPAGARSGSKSRTCRRRCRRPPSRSRMIPRPG